MKNITKTQILTKKQFAARICASLLELSVIMMILLLLSSMLTIGYLNIAAGNSAGFESFSNGTAAVLAVSGLGFFLPIFLFWIIGDSFDPVYSSEGYVFQAIFDFADKAKAFFKSRNDSTPSGYGQPVDTNIPF